MIMTFSLREVAGMPDNYHEELVAFCKRLKIASAMADRAETTEGETHVEFLYNLLKREIERKW